MFNRLLTLFTLLSLVSVAEACSDKIPASIPEHQAPVNVSKPALQDGTRVPLALVNKLNVKSAKPGDQVQFRVADDVLWRDQIVITKGTLDTANITEARGAKWPSRGSALALTLHSVAAADGKEVPVRAAVSMKGGINKVAGVAWALTGGTRELGVFFAPAAIALSLTTKGHNENAPAGMHLYASVDGDYPISDVQATSEKASAASGIVFIGLSPEFYRTILYCNGSPVSRLSRKRVLRLELPAGYYRFATTKSFKQEIYVIGGKEQAVIVDSTGISPLANEWSNELKARKPEKPEHKFDASTTCVPLPEQSAPKELLPEVIKSDVLIHQFGTTGNEVGDIAKQ